MSVLDRMKAAFRRLSPSFPNVDPDTDAGKELDSMAAGLAVAAEPVDSALDEVMPDTTSDLLERWERIVRRPSRLGDSDAVRQGRIAGVLRRTRGPGLAALRAMLTEAFDLTEDEILFIEPSRQQIEDAISVEIPWRDAQTGANLIEIYRPWPGAVDDFGVQLEIESDGSNFSSFKLISPKGTEWDLGNIELEYGWGGEYIRFRATELFEGEPAAGTWKIQFTRVGSAVGIWFKLLVSNTVDSASIFNFYAVRDADLAGEPDIAEGQRLFERTAHGHNYSTVVERMSLVHDDDHSLHDREPHGDPNP